MDYKPPACIRCGYALPMTWTNKQEMAKMMTAAGWTLAPAVCTECRRKEWQKERLRSIFATAADSPS